jgi:hypothetical protein
MAEKIVYADPDLADPGDGTKEAPFNDLQTAWDAFFALPYTDDGCFLYHRKQTPDGPWWDLIGRKSTSTEPKVEAFMNPNPAITFKLWP